MQRDVSSAKPADERQVPADRQLISAVDSVYISVSSEKDISSMHTAEGSAGHERRVDRRLTSVNLIQDDEKQKERTWTHCASNHPGRNSERQWSTRPRYVRNF